MQLGSNVTPVKLSIAVLKNPKDMIFFVAYPSRTKQLFEIKKVLEPKEIFNNLKRIPVSSFNGFRYELLWAHFLKFLTPTVLFLAPKDKLQHTSGASFWEQPIQPITLFLFDTFLFLSSFLFIVTKKVLKNLCCLKKIVTTTSPH